MEQQTTYEACFQEAQTMLSQSYDMDSIVKQLKQKGADDLIITDILKEIKSIRNAQRTKTGTKLALTGVILLGVGFVSCIAIHFNDGDIGFSLYGLTAAGAVILVAGLVYIFS